MLPSALLALREGVEAALVIGITLGVLRKLNRAELRSAVWSGAAVAAIASLLLAFILRLVGSELEGTTEVIFEGVSLWLAAGILTWMIFWMQRQSRAHSRSLEQQVQRSLAMVGRWPLFWVAFLAVFREGVELAFFLLAAGIEAGAAQSLIGAGLGLVIAAALGGLLFTSTRRLPLASFFQVTNILLILFCAGLFAHGVRSFNEINLIPPVIDHIYNLNAVINENSLLAQILNILFGYNGNPSLSEAVGYLVYFAALLAGLWWFFRRPVLKVREQ